MNNPFIHNEANQGFRDGKSGVRYSNPYKFGTIPFSHYYYGYIVGKQDRVNA